MCPPDTKQWTNAGLMLIRCRRGWPNINPSLISVSIVYWLTLCDIYLHYSIDAYIVFRKLENIYLLSYCTMDHIICLSTVQYGLSTILAKYVFTLFGDPVSNPICIVYLHALQYVLHTQFSLHLYNKNNQSIAHTPVNDIF